MIAFSKILSAFVLLGVAQPLRSQTQCDPALEKECFTNLCTINPDREIPLDEETLVKELDKFSYRMDSDLKKDLKKLDGVLKGATENLTSMMSGQALTKIVDEIFDMPMWNMDKLQSIFSDEMSMREVEGQQEFTFSDMNEVLSEETKQYILEYQKIANPFLYKGKDQKTLSDNLKKMKEELSQVTGKDYQAIKHHHDQPFLSDYRDFVKNKLAPYKAAVKGDMAKKIQKSIADSLLTEEGRKSFDQSCKTASFLEKKLSKVSKRQFKKMAEKVINEFKQNFLSKLSQSTFEQLSKEISKDAVQLIEEPHSHPDFSDYSNEFEHGYTPSSDENGLARDLALLGKSKYLACQPSAHFAKDHYDALKNKIHITRTTVALGQEAVISHELGHLFSHLMMNDKLSSHSSEKMLALRKCIQGFYPNSGEPSTSFSSFRGDSLRTEEDFADFIAAKATPNGLGFNCDLRGMIQTYMPKYGDSFYEPKENASHSNILFRELHRRLGQGEKIPQSCLTIMNNSSAKPVKCEF